MGKLAKPADPLRPQAARVERSRAQTSDNRRRLPAWYYRILQFSYKGDRDVEDWDFDEDLSELEDDKEQRNTEQRKGEEEKEGEEAREAKEEEEEEEDCEWCGEDSDCDCSFEDDYTDGVDMDDNKSERSYDGSDADYYYELKERREERKWEKLQEREDERKEKERKRKTERAKEEEVRAAYKAFKKARKEHKRIPIGPLAGQSFYLFCSDHVDHLYSSDYYPTKRVDFHLPDDVDDDTDGGTDNPRQDNKAPGGETGMLYGQVYLNVNSGCDFGPFRPPKRARRKLVKVKTCSEPEHELSLKFIGNGYLKLRIPREIVFMGHGDADPPAFPPTAPEVFEFVGIWPDREKEEAERQETQTPEMRSPSPTWFESNNRTYRRYLW